ncbi:MAG: hypothetical protein ACXWUG_15605 [Polyangiales bacterium]
MAAFAAMRFLLAPLTFAGLFVACGGTTPAKTVAPVASGSASATSSAPPVAADVAVCTRVCAVQTRCGGDAGSCRSRCMPIARTLAGDVLESLVSCVEKKASPTCEPGDAGTAARKQLVRTCTIEATQAKAEDAKANVDLFANAYCDRSQTCGVEGGSFVKSNCLGKARGAILATVSEGQGGLLGSLRPSKVDEMVKCISNAKCEGRKSDADEELSRCLDEILASAAESP